MLALAARRELGGALVVGGDTPANSVRIFLSLGSDISRSDAVSNDRNKTSAPRTAVTPRRSWYPTAQAFGRSATI
jgi:hypothetical protein